MTPSDPQEAIIDMAVQCRHDPLRWAEFAWDWGQGELKDKALRVWQRELLAEIRDRLADPVERFQPIQIARASGHGIGKSAIFGIVQNWAMSCFTNARIVTTANTAIQLRTKTSPEIGKWFRLSITGDWFHVNSMSIKAKDKKRTESWRSDLVTWSEHNTEAFAGLHNEGNIIVLIFDEASGIPEKIWEVAHGALTDENTIILWLVFGNPTLNSGPFRECFRNNRKFWSSAQIDSRSVEGTNKKFIARLQEQYGEDSDIFKVRVRGQFPTTSMKQFIDTADVDAARVRHIKREQFEFAETIIGVDPAWTGADSFEIYMRQGLFSMHLGTYPKNDNDIQMAQIIARFEDEYKADQVFIDGGYGTGIVSAGKTWGRTWQLVWFSGKSADPQCYNKRMEMWKLLRNWLKDGGVIDPRDQILYDDLIGPELVPRSDGVWLLESKEDMKDRGLPSPNKGDALALTFAHPVKKKTNRIVPTFQIDQRNTAPRQTRNPYA